MINYPQKQSVMDVIMLFLLYVVAFVFMDKGYLAMVLYRILPLLFVLSIITYGNPFRQNWYMKMLFVLFGWIGITYFAAFYKDVAFDQMKQLLGVVMMCSICANLSKNNKNIPWLYGVYILYYISILRFAHDNVLDEITMFEERLDGEGVNANMLAYFTFYTTIAIYMLGDLVKWKYVRVLFRVLFILTIVLSFFIAMLTASRQVLIMQVPLYLALFTIRYTVKSIWHFLLLAVVFVIVILSVKDSIIGLYDGSLLEERYELSVEEDDRTLILKEAFEYGLENPLFGLGPGNFMKYSSRRAFSHCTYVELFANSGLMAALMYILLLLRFIVIQWRRYKMYKQTPYLIFAIFGIFFSIDNFFYVFYTGLWLMGFFMLVATHSEMYHKNCTKIHTA